MSLRLITGRIDKARARIEKVFAHEGPAIAKPIPESELAAIEKKLGIALPPTLRELYTKVGASYRWSWTAPFGSGLLQLIDARELEQNVVARKSGRITLLRITSDGDGGGYVLDQRERGNNEVISFCPADGVPRVISPSFANFMAIWAEQGFIRDRDGEGARVVAALIKSGKLPTKMPAAVVKPPTPKIPPLVLDANAAELDGDRRGLREVPSEVAQMTKLRRLHLEDNELASLPSFVSKLARLETVNLSGNPLGNAATLRTLSELPRLKWLMMWDCFGGALPKEIGELVSLKFLSLRHNDLAEVPAELGKLRKLEELTLSENRLTQLPDSVSDLRALKWLFIEKNPIDLDRTFQQLAGLPRLERLVFTAGDEIPASLAKLVHLTHVFVHNASPRARKQLSKLVPKAKVTAHR
jgi:hypothetical protein